MAFSPLDQRVYRRKSAGTSTTDPSLDPSVWGLVDTGPAVVVVVGTTQDASPGTHYVLTSGSATTVTLPPSPTSGDAVWVTEANGLASNTVQRNGRTIMTLAEDLTLDKPGASVQLRYVNNDWKII